MTQPTVSSTQSTQRSSWKHSIGERLNKLDHWAASSRPLFLVAVAIILTLLLVLRHPRGLFDANFWAEDGWVWYPDAYRLSFSSLLRPHSGYLQTFPRLIAILSQPLPLLWAPTIFTAVAFAVRLFPPMLLLSRRFDGAWPSLMARLLLSIIYICLPNSFEGFANVTNSQWHLAIVGFLLVAGASPLTRTGRTCDLLAITLCCLSGPFCFMLLPIAAWSWATTRSHHARNRLLSVLGWTVVQGYLLMLTATQTRSSVSLGVDVVNLARILAVQVDLGLILGSHVTSRLAKTPMFDWAPFVLSLAAAGLAACAIAAWRGPALFRKFALFGALIFAASLLSPVVSLDAPAWVVLGRPGAGQRYFLIPMLVLAAASITLASLQPILLRGAGMILCVAVIAGVAGDWPYPRMRRTDFNSQARLFEQAPSGTEMAFGVHPTGVAPMVLIKR